MRGDVPSYVVANCPGSKDTATLSKSDAFVTWKPRKRRAPSLSRRSLTNCLWPSRKATKARGDVSAPGAGRITSGENAPILKGWAQTPQASSTQVGFGLWTFASLSATRGNTRSTAGDQKKAAVARSAPRAKVSNGTKRRLATGRGCFAAAISFAAAAKSVSDSAGADARRFVVANGAFDARMSSSGSSISAEVSELMLLRPGAICSGLSCSMSGGVRSEATVLASSGCTGGAGSFRGSSKLFEVSSGRRGDAARGCTSTVAPLSCASSSASTISLRMNAVGLSMKLMAQSDFVC